MVSEQITEERSRKKLKIVQQIANQIIDISEKLKIVERVDPTLMNGAAVDLVELVDFEVKKVCSSHPSIMIETDMPNHAWIEGDTSLQYAIREALENAILHHDQAAADCEISIQIIQDSETVSLKISDNGPGIPQEETQALQTQKETPLVHMSSIGLWLITWLCHLHNGSIEVRTDDGTTLLFHFQPESEDPLIELGSSRQEN